ncbi:serine--tRNA ligase [Mangrovihabitans endophyticus]|uniref:Serine--tRNA ligase n=1 Tax=Mangrovihabitans endophyticus TaxID=1751298 RepID=A0A8J3FPM9_9ACTN|nr:serine--tRNA ligase [Mangrovihabitans endophyticus]GGL02621.1 serine--tRNA ligase [Mangrovihabitans endophyticus]
MHDPRALVDMGADAVRRLARRGYTLDLEGLEDLLSRRNKSIHRADELRAESKRVAQEVQSAARQGADTGELKQRARDIKDEIRDVEAEQEQLAGRLNELMLGIPNLPLDTAPDGDSEDFAVEVRRHGDPPTFAFPPKDHVDLGEALGILDFGRATKLSGPRFSVARGAGARLERGLAAYFLDLHTRRHGYVEHSVPFLVTPATMTGTGQLPKFEEDLFKTGTNNRDLYLIPTAEVPLANLHAEEILDAGDLPLAYTAYTPCFRSEAGSYGKDTRGLIRLHQFAKVEMVRFCAPEESQRELETMVGHAEACLAGLGLPYRVVTLAAGDMGFSAQLTYDIEVYLPGQGRYREISSCSDCGTFQARRARIRSRDKDGKRGLVATLNGSGLPIGRTVAAILENNQRADGSVVMPPALVPYLGFHTIAADGTPQV